MQIGEVRALAELKFESGDRLSHAYILTAPSPEKRAELAHTLAAAAVCTGSGAVPCGTCRACRKCASGIHPDVITFRRDTDSSGRPKRELNVDKIRTLSADACVLPNEAERKVYIIEDADTMNTAAQNAALKLLEEPPRGVILLLCVQNPQLLLPTVRSRCVEMTLSGEEEKPDEATAEAAAELIALVAAGKETELFRRCIHWGSTMDTRSAEDFFAAARLALGDVLCRRTPSPLSSAEAMHLYTLLEKCGDYLKVNTGVSHIFGLLAVDAISGNRGK